MPSSVDGDAKTFQVAGGALGSMDIQNGLVNGMRAREAREVRGVL